MAQDFVSKVDILKSSKQCFVLNTLLWEGYSNAEFDWNSVEFTAENKKHIPAQSGIYAFFVVPGIAGFRCNSYLMYIGKAGDNSENSLRARYGQYLYEQKRPKRYHIHYLLNKWGGNIHFAYCAFEGVLPDIGMIEQDLLDAFVPPFSRGGYSVELGKEIKGLA